MAEWMNRKSFLLVMSFYFNYLPLRASNRCKWGLAFIIIKSTIKFEYDFEMYRFTWISNSDEYAVTGLPDSVALRLEGPNSLILSTTGNGTYRVKTPNLTELGEGKHTITLEVTGLPTGVHGIVSPETVEINIEKIRRRKFQLS